MSTAEAQSFMNNTERAFALRNIRQRLADPKHWTKWREARNAKGYEVHVTDKAATSFCLLGAAHFSGLPFDETTELLASVIPRGQIPGWSTHFGDPGPYCTAFHWNDADSRRHSEVMAMLDNGIKKFDPTYVPPKQTLWQRFQSWRAKGVSAKG